MGVALAQGQEELSMCGSEYYPSDGVALAQGQGQEELSRGKSNHFSLEWQIDIDR